MSDINGQLTAEVEMHVLRLYVTGNSELSSRAIGNIKALCETYLKGRYTLMVVDLYSEKDRAQEDQIIVVPTLVRHWPLPMRRLIGDLSDTPRVISVLGLTPSIPSCDS